MRRKSVCLPLCLSAPSSAFPVARSRTPTAAFESDPCALGTYPHLAHGQPEGGVELPGLLSPLILPTRQLSAPCSASWRKTPAHRVGQSLLVVIDSLIGTRRRPLQRRYR